MRSRSRCYDINCLDVPDMSKSSVVSSVGALAMGWRHVASLDWDREGKRDRLGHGRQRESNRRYLFGDVFKGVYHYERKGRLGYGDKSRAWEGGRRS